MLVCGGLDRDRAGNFVYAPNGLVHGATTELGDTERLFSCDGPVLYFGENAITGFRLGAATEVTQTDSGWHLTFRLAWLRKDTHRHRADQYHAAQQGKGDAPTLRALTSTCYVENVSDQDWPEQSAGC